MVNIFKLKYRRSLWVKKENNKETNTTEDKRNRR